MFYKNCSKISVLFGYCIVALKFSIFIVPILYVSVCSDICFTRLLYSDYIYNWEIATLLYDATIRWIYLKYSLSIGLKVYQGSYSLVVLYLYRATLIHFFDEIKYHAEHYGITDILANWAISYFLAWNRDWKCWILAVFASSKKFVCSDASSLQAGQFGWSYWTLVEFANMAVSVQNRSSNLSFWNCHAVRVGIEIKCP